MSRKDYVAIAAVILDTRKATDNVIVQATLSTLAVKLCADFAADNARFDQQRFLQACGAIR